MIGVLTLLSGVLLCGMFLAQAATGAELFGRVVSVHDGDTLTVLVSREQIEVRLIDVHAPELGRELGTRSRQSLAELCVGREARVAEKGKDRYWRTLGQVTCASVDANAEQVRRGMAWVFDAPQDSPLHDLQREAQAMRRGMWGDPAPEPACKWCKRE